MIERIIGGVVVGLAAACVLLVLVSIWEATRPSCAERGGDEVYSGTFLMPMWVGKVMILMPMSTYECVLPPRGGR